MKIYIYINKNMAGKREVGEFTFECSEGNCQYGTNRRDTFKLHILTEHTDEKDKPWKYCTKENCKKRFLTNGRLNDHIKKVHGERVIQCPTANCDVETVDQRGMDSHIYHCHTEDTNTFICDYDGCTESRKTKQTLCVHKLVHSDERKFKCDIKKCISMFKSKSELKSHKDRVHKEKEKTFKCDQPDCSDGPFIDITSLNSHKRNRHKIGVKQMFKCGQGACLREFVKKSAHTQHLADSHKINVILHRCTKEGCKYSTGQITNCRRHMATQHGINARKFICDEKDCNEEVDEKWKLKRHKEEKHNTGKYKCDFCDQNRNSRERYKDTQGIHKICSECYKKTTGKNSRIERELSNYMDKHIGTEFLLGSDKSLKALGGCQLYRPDKIYTSDEMTIMVECDEHQHGMSNTSYSCDEKRISDIYDEFAGKNMIVIRWNPHAYKPPQGSKKIALKDRKTALIKLFNDLRLKKHKDQIHIYYMYYNADNPHIVQNMPFTLLY